MDRQEHLEQMELMVRAGPTELQEQMERTEHQEQVEEQ